MHCLRLDTALLFSAVLLLLPLPPALTALPAPPRNNTSPPAFNNSSPKTTGAVRIGDLHVRGHSRSHPELCPERGARVRLVILVTSAPAHAAARDAVRLTWGHYGARSDVTLAFVLGAPPAHLEAAIAFEDDIYGDLIVGRFVDSYSNLTLKTLSMLEWVHAYCPRAPRLLKTDDDVFINVPRLIEFASSATWTEARRTIWGRLAHEWLPKRDPEDKYYVPREEFPGAVFPEYVTGPAYLLTADCARPLLAAAAREPYLRLEDVLVTGLLAKRLAIRRLNMPEFYNRRPQRHPCAVHQLISVHQVLYHEQFDLWRKLLDGNNHCNITSSPP